MDVLRSIWGNIRRFLWRSASERQGSVVLQQYEPVQSLEPEFHYNMVELEEADTITQEELKEATTGGSSSVIATPRPNLKAVAPIRPVEYPPKPKLRLVKPRIQPLLEEVVAYGRSRTNLLEEAFITQLLARDIEDSLVYQDNTPDYTFHTRWVAANTPLSAFERFKDVPLAEQWARLNHQGVADEVVWRFNTGLGAVPLPKLDAYREQSGWMELLEVVVNLPQEPEPSKHAFLIAYTDEGEVLGHPFCNSMALLPAEIRPITTSHWFKPNMDAEKANLVKAYMKTRLFDELMADLDGWRQRTHEKLRVGLGKTEYLGLFYTPEELVSWKGEYQQAFLDETEAIDAIHERLLTQMEDFSKLQYKYQTIVSLRWELI